MVPPSSFAPVATDDCQLQPIVGRRWLRELGRSASRDPLGEWAHMGNLYVVCARPRVGGDLENGGTRPTVARGTLFA
jgi:hypothetical protein